LITLAAVTSKRRAIDAACLLNHAKDLLSAASDCHGRTAVGKLHAIMGSSTANPTNCLEMAAKNKCLARSEKNPEGTKATMFLRVSPHGQSKRHMRCGFLTNALNKRSSKWTPQL
jgi:hypothetical protein